jgi:uncharacterized protein (TIRG00374 family)
LFLIASLVLAIDFPIESIQKLKKHGITVSPECGVYPTGISVSFENESSFNISYKLGVSDSTGFQRYKNPIQLQQNTYIQVKLEGSGAPKSIFIGTFIVGRNHTLPVICLKVNPKEFFPPTGIYDGKLIQAGSNANETTGPGNQFIGNSWKKTPIPCFVQFFYNNKLVEATACHVKTFGGWTLGLPEKSLHLYTDTLVGKKEFEYKFFKNKPYNEFEHLVLRTSGSDQNFTRFKDISISSFAAELMVDYMDYQQAILYVNDRYFGIINLREKINKEYLGYNHNAAKDFTQLLEQEGGNSKDYQSLKAFAAAHYTDSNFPEEIEKLMDLEDYFNYSFLEIYIANVDSRGNIRYWKDVSSENKWRWIYYDGDLGCAGNFHRQNFLSERISPVQTDWYNPTWVTHLLRFTTLNPDLRNRFIQQTCLLMSTILHKDSVVNRVDQFANAISPEIPYHVNRFPIEQKETEKGWRNHVSNYRRFWEIRPVSMHRHVKETFGLGDSVHLHLTTNIPNEKLLIVNGSKLHFNNVEGDFFKNIPLPLAIPEHSFPFVFKQWSDGIKDKKRVLDCSNSLAIEATFAHAPLSNLKGKLHIRRFGSEMKAKNPMKWIEIVNQSNEPIDLNGIVLYDSPNGIVDNLFTHSAGETIAPLSSVIFVSPLHTNDISQTLHLPEGTTIYPLQFPTGFQTDHSFYLGDKENAVIDSMFVHFPDSIFTHGKHFVCFFDENGNISYDRVTQKTKFDWDVKEIKSTKQIMSNLSELPLWIYLSNGFALLLYVLLAFFKKIKWRDAIRYFAFTALAIGLLYWAYKGVSIQDIVGQILNTHWIWIVAALLIEYVSVIFRGIRWNQLLKPLGYKANTWNAIHSVAFGYCMNDLVPRSGEVARCTLLFKSDKIPVSTLVGTVIVERVIDMVMFGLLLLWGILLLPSTLSSLMNETKSPGFSMELGIALIVLAVIGILVLRYILKHTFKNKFIEKFAEFIRGTWRAFLSVGKIEGKFKFIFLTVGIWGAWLLMTWFNLLAVPGCEHMGLNESVFLMICASLAMLAPTPGGLGAFHSITIIGFIVLGYADESNASASLLGLTFATVSWSTRTLMEISSGLAGFFIVSYRIKYGKTASTN